jgi:hypothetical protein
MSRLVGTLLRVLASVAVMGLLATSVTATPARAAESIPSWVVGAPTVSSLPNANIIKLSTGRVIYNPRTLTAPVTTGTCSTTNYSFSIHNKTAVPQQLIFNGAAYGNPIPAGGAQFVCTGAGTLVFRVNSNRKTSLTVTVQ